MNRYPLWKYVLIAVALLFGAIYTAPNFFPESPAIQVSSQKATVKVDAATLARVEGALKSANVPYDTAYLETVGLNQSVRVRFSNADIQLKAKDTLSTSLNTDASDPTYVVALSLVSTAPRWLTSFYARPMYLGLDLRGGVHFLLQVNTAEAVNKRIEALVGDVRTLLRERDVRHAGIVRSAQQIEIRFRDDAARAKADGIIRDNMRELAVRSEQRGEDMLLIASITPAALKEVGDNALKQNITTLHKRINELGVSEPVIQQQGADRVVIQLPGVQDTARAKDIIGRTATLEVRMVEAHASAEARARDYDPARIESALKGVIPQGTDLLFSRREGREEPLLISKQVVFSGDNLTRADANLDQQTQGWVVDITLDARGAAAMRSVTREGVKRRMAVILIEKGKPEVLTAPTIQSELGSRFQITGMRSPQEANDLALLMRAGALAAPMEIIEERTIGPSLGEANIRAGFKSTWIGFAAIALFMTAYYHMFGFISVLALSANLLLLVALLSLLQATLTLPGIAAIALTLGMAIDANVLINERVREELRRGKPPQQAIHEGYDRAFATILDSNVTTFIAGIFLFLLGSGPVRGFAVVHCLGILTSIFCAVFVSRGFVNLWYGSRKRLASVSIGSVWRPDAAAAK